MKTGARRLIGGPLRCRRPGGEWWIYPGRGESSLRSTYIYFRAVRINYFYFTDLFMLYG
jgi:hypothetical protein